jgi:acyl phosphate:glycerol-3-phosphate acyltransferase
MDILWIVVLITASYILGSCPFSVWIGKLLMGKDIRKYGDGNPGAANVFKAGSIGLGFLSVFLDIAKGFPFVFLSYNLFGFNDIVMYLVGLSAVLGHAFSPFLHFRGGKSYAVTLGVFLALPDKDVLIVLLSMMILGFLFLDGDGWRAALAMVTVVVYTIVVGKSGTESLFFALITAVIVLKNMGELRSLPRRKKKLYIGFGQGEN